MKKEEILQTIKTFEETLKRYKLDLEKNPGSTFYAGLVKNTEDYIEELMGELKKQSLSDKLGKLLKN
jgi:hypothetical protein